MIGLYHDQKGGITQQQQPIYAGQALPEQTSSCRPGCLSMPATPWISFDLACQRRWWSNCSSGTSFGWGSCILHEAWVDLTQMIRMIKASKLPNWYPAGPLEMKNKRMIRYQLDRFWSLGSKLPQPCEGPCRWNWTHQCSKSRALVNLGTTAKNIIGYCCIHCFYGLLRVCVYIFSFKTKEQ